ncbi:MAG: hypothetical protein K6F84_05185 [Lachnospiraceae bacterium]|nr:hypothetical protein [Lachnospiraceae bacterium]
MKNKKYMLLILALCTVCASSCGLNKGKDARSEVDADVVVEEIGADENIEEDIKNALESADENVGEIISNVESETKVEVSLDSEDETELTKEELDKFEELFATEEYNGFLNCSYDKPEDIDWYTVLYLSMNYVDCRRVERGSDEEKAYFKEIGIDVTEDTNDSDLELLVEPWAFKRADYDSYIKEHTGISLDEIKDKEFYTYVEEYDSYYWKPSDALYNFLKVSEGTRKGNVYTVKFVPDESDTYHLSLDYSATITFKEENGKYLIMSNKIHTNEE